MMYELLAHVYDALVKDDEATACWVELIKAHIRGTELLELACGSGEITIALAQEGYHVDASDLSAAMIEEAKKKDGSEQVSWSVMDMCDLHTDKSYDGILCLCDSFNYLLKDEQVRALFQGAYRHHNQCRSSHCCGKVSHMLRCEEGQSQRQRHFLNLIQHNQWIQIIVPVIQECEDSQCTKCWSYLRNNDFPENREISCPVQLSTFNKLSWYLITKLLA